MPGPLEPASGVGLSWQVTATGEPAFAQLAGKVPVFHPAGRTSIAVELSVAVVRPGPKFLAVSLTLRSCPWLVQASGGTVTRTCRSGRPVMMFVQV